jgi:hypothetical protein
VSHNDERFEINNEGFEIKRKRMEADDVANGKV